jgi:hypothetical protein
VLALIDQVEASGGVVGDIDDLIARHSIDAAGRMTALRLEALRSLHQRADQLNRRAAEANGGVGSTQRMFVDCERDVAKLSNTANADVSIENMAAVLKLDTKLKEAMAELKAFFAQSAVLSELLCPLQQEVCRQTSF